MIRKFPKVLILDVPSMQGKVDYLYKNLGANANCLLKFPHYLSYDLVSHIMPRCEFLRSIGSDPAKFLQCTYQYQSKSTSLKDLITASPTEMEELAGRLSQSNFSGANKAGLIYQQFQNKFVASMKKRKDQL